MIPRLARFIDWFALQGVPLLLTCHDGQDSGLAAAVDFLDGPDFLPAESPPATVTFTDGPAGLQFTFPSPRPGEFAENNLVHGRLYRCAGRWQERPTIILLHGGGDVPNHRWGFP